VLLLKQLMYGAVIEMENDTKVLFKFTLPYPWKKLLNGLSIVSLPVVIILFIFITYYYFYLHPNSDKIGWVISTILIFSIYIAIDVAQRYVLIHLDKIKAPIEVWADEYEVHFKKGRAKMDFSMEGLKSVRVVLDDKMVMLETNYEKDSDWEKGWKVAFKRNNELELVDYKEFIEKTFLPFTEVVIRRLKELNPGIRVVKEDRRKKYR